MYIKLQYIPIPLLSAINPDFFSTRELLILVPHGGGCTENLEVCSRLGVMTGVL
jgi:hypothetical protein